VTAIHELARGRDSYARRAWGEVHRSLTRADQASPLGADDLRLLATAAYMLGRDDDYLGAMERAHHQYVQAGEGPPAARCAFWIGLNRLLRGETARATGWFARGRRLLDRDERDCVERGYLLIPELLSAAGAGDWDAASRTAAEATEVAERFGDADLLALAGHELGHALIRRGQLVGGFRLLDEAMVATGLVYCSVIAYCHDLRGWVRDAWQRIRRFSTRGNYINFQTADEDEERIRATYGAQFERLVEVKTTYDPDNLFRSNRTSVRGRVRGRWTRATTASTPGRSSSTGIRSFIGRRAAGPRSC
jgi:hypothetical protein